MAEKKILDIFKLDTVQDAEILQQLYGEASEGASQEASLQTLLSLLPGNISGMIQLALRQERPFLPPDVTPEMMAETNDTLQCMNHIEILYRCIARAAVSDNMDTMAALIYVVDRAAYRFGASRALLQVLDILLDRAPHTPVAPQVIIRKARVMKDDGDLHGAVGVLDAVISKESIWDYKDDGQYINVKAVCVQIKGHILHNLGMWKDAIEPLVESVDSFNKLHDDKGTSSSLGLLTKCLKKLTMADYNEMKQKYPTIFSQSHPCFEAYVKGMDAVKYIIDLGQTLYVAKHQLVAEESLLMFALQQPPSLREFQWFQTIVADIKKTLTTHETVNNLKSLETYFEFVRAIFLIHLTLYFSPFSQDRSLSKYLEQVSIELYRHLCSCQSRRQLVTKLEHTRNSVSFMNASLGILGLPSLQGTDDVSVNVEVSSADDSSGKTEKKADAGKESNAEHMSDKAGTVPALGNPSTAASRQNPGTFPGAVKSQNPKATDLYLRKYIGLTVDASLFSTTSASSSQSGSDVTSSKDENTEDPELVNLSVVTISATVEKFKNLDLNSGSENLDAFNDKNIAPSTQSTVQTSHRNKTTSTSASSDISLTDSSASRKSTSSSSGSAGLSSSYTSSSRVSGESGFSSPTQQSSNESSASYVDLSATTEEWHNLTDELGELSPLVDLSPSTVNSSLEGLQFGHSVETRSAEEYLEHWEPPTVDETIKVNKALLLTYNPVTGDWLSQSTLVHRGQELDLGGNRKGNCREVFEVYFLHQDEPLGRYVCKRYWQQRPARYYQQDVVCQMMAGYYVTKFNQALHNYHSNIQVQFLPAAHLQLLTPDGLLEDWVNVEPYLHGDFIKLTNNLAFSKKEHHGEELATALTHFSYCESQGVLMIVDIQGWFPREGSGIIYLTDPQFHTKGVRRFSPADRQDEGMTLFWSKVHPECNSICSTLGLTRPQQ